MYEWQKALLRSGDKRLTHCASTALLIATYGNWGHGAFPSVSTLAAASGESESTVGRHLGLLRRARWLLAHPRPGRTTVYCIPAVDNGRPLGAPGGDHPCQFCRRFSSTTVTGDGAPEAPVTDDQEVLSRTSAAAGPPQEPRSHSALVLAQQLYALRPHATEDELLLFARVADEFVGHVSYELLGAATEAFAQRGEFFTEAAIRSFFSRQRTPRGTASARPARDIRAVSPADQALIEAKRRVIIDWERDRDDAQSGSWIAQVGRCAPRLLDEVIAEWRSAGRGG